MNGHVPVYYDCHCHTWLCLHAVGTVMDLAEAAERRGLKGLVVTCHNPLPIDPCPGSRMSLAQWPTYLQMVGDARAEMSGRVDVRLGLEVDWLADQGDFIRRQLQQVSLDMVLGSVHANLPHFYERFAPEDVTGMVESYYAELVDCARTGLFDCLTHIDLIKTVLPAGSWSPVRFQGVIDCALDQIASTGVAVELNTSGWIKQLGEPFPGMWLLRGLARRRIPLVLGSDAHCPERIGGGFEHALTLAEQAGYGQVHYCLSGVLHGVPIDQVRASLISPSYELRVRPKPWQINR